MVPGKCQISRLYLADNRALKKKAGIFIGDAFMQNKDHPLEKLSFKNVALGEDSLMRIIEALNANRNITNVHLGLVSDQGLLIMARNLKDNTSLRKMKMQENPVSRWGEKSKNEFIKLLRTQKVPLNKVKFEDADEVLANRAK